MGIFNISIAASLEEGLFRPACETSFLIAHTQSGFLSRSQAAAFEEGSFRLGCETKFEPLTARSAVSARSPVFNSQPPIHWWLRIGYWYSACLTCAYVSKLNFDVA